VRVDYSKNPVVINFSYSLASLEGSYSSKEWIEKVHWVIGLCYSDKYVIHKDEYIVSPPSSNERYVSPGELVSHHLIAIRKDDE
jgi:hypothetical protein